MSTAVEQIKERLGILDVISSYITVQKSGSNYKAKCPFHNEKTPSFFISPDRNSYYCFGCGAKGDIFSFVEQFEGLDFKGSLKVLADRAGVNLELDKRQSSQSIVEKSEKEKLYEIMEETCRFFERNLNKIIDATKSDSTTVNEPYKYLKKRGLTDETIKDFRIGWAPQEWRDLYDYLFSKNYTVDLIEKAGLIKKAENGNGYYDRFRGRIIFPICDTGGRVIAFTGRILNDDGQSAKYLNSPETPLFKKANVLYGLDKAKLAIRQKDYSILVEGQMDLIMSHQAGFKNIVAGSGTALTDNTISDEERINNFGLVKRLSSNIVLVYDSDKAGEKAAERSADIALSLGMDVKIATLPEGLDPADAILKDVEIWKNALRNSTHVIEFVINVTIKNSPDERRSIRAISEKVLPLIARLQKSSEQAFFIKMIKDKTGIGEEALRDDLKKIIYSSPKVPQNKYENNKEITDKKVVDVLIKRKDIALRKLLGIIIWQKSKDNNKFNIKVVQNELERIFSLDLESILEKAGGEKGSLSFESEITYADREDLDNISAELLLVLEEDLLKEIFSSKMKELSLAEKNKDMEKAKAILMECQEITKKLQAITVKRNS